MTAEHIETKDPRIDHFGNMMTAEASTLGFGVGRWPERFQTSDGHMFERKNMIVDERENELLAVKYRDVKTGGILKVFND